MPRKQRLPAGAFLPSQTPGVTLGFRIRRRSPSR